jgi:ATP-dependent RNA helicase DDX3X
VFINNAPTFLLPHPLRSNLPVQSRSGSSTSYFLHITPPAMSDAGSNAGLDEAAIARKQQLTTDLARAKEAGWNNPIPFNYDTVAGGEAAPDETRDSAAWLSDAAVYAWDDEFGDVGEPNPKLEQELFTGEHLQRAGGAIKALSFDVSLEGPVKVQPVRDVSLTYPATRWIH